MYDSIYIRVAFLVHNTLRRRQTDGQTADSMVTISDNRPTAWNLQATRNYYRPSRLAQDLLVRVAFLCTFSYDDQ